MKTAMRVCYRDYDQCDGCGNHHIARHWIIALPADYRRDQRQYRGRNKKQDGQWIAIGIFDADWKRWVTTSGEVNGHAACDADKTAG